jgi:TonB-dependent starch-binding outer membrane protein SusC
MKLITFLLAVCIMQISAVTYSQSQKINLSVKNFPLEKVLQEIEKQTNFRFLYRLENVENKSADLTCSNLSVEQILDKVLENQGVTYKMLNNNLIVITPIESAQTLKVTGTVTDASNKEALVGVNIIVEGTTIGTTTDTNGNYTINVPNGNVILIFSYIGYPTEKIPVNDQKIINLSMIPDIKSLDEIIVIGYGTTKKSDLTGSVTSANLKDFEKSPNTNLVQSLQGSIAGLNVGQVTSAGATPDITLRGAMTINGSSSLLIVMDGIIYKNSLSSINPSDIESVDILKDASATSVYGAQAANGVMLITTKKGKAGKAKISLSSSYSIQNPTHNYSTMNHDQYLWFLQNLMWKQAYTEESGYTEDNPNFSLYTYLPDSYMKNIDGSISTTDTHWWDLCTRQGSILENQGTIAGGNEAISYLVSFGNTSQKNFLVNDNFKRNSVRVNIDAKIRPWWKLGTQLSGSFVNQDGAEPTLWTLYSMNPLASPYKADGSINPTPMETARDNPLTGSNVIDKERHNYFIGNLYSEFQLPIKGLTYRINFGNNYTINSHYQANPYGNSQTGEAYKENSFSYNYTVDNIVNYTKDFNLHSITATLVYGIRKENYEYTKADATKFSSLNLGYNSLEVGTNQYTTSDANDNSSLYQMARLNYKFNNRYLLTATIRRDGFSGFAANYKSALFPSLALGWVVSDESFFKSISVISYLKLRCGYGVSGNLPYNDKTYNNSYKSLSTATSSAGYVFGDGNTAVIRQELTSMENKNLKWERTGGLNIGLDFHLLKDRIEGSVDAYKTTTTDLLYNVSIPTMTGFSSIADNVGKLENKGIEFMVTSYNITSKNFKWSTMFNISANKNKIVELTGKGDMVSSGLFIGKSIGAIYDYRIDGIYQVGDEIPTGYNIGNYKIHNMDDNEAITTADRTIVGKREPAYRFGIMNKLSFKNVSLSFFINSVQGGKNGYLGENTYTLIQDNTSRLCNHLDVFKNNVWSPLNPNGIYSASTSNGDKIPIRYEDRSFIRLQDVTLSYDLPKTLISAMKLENINIYITGKNLLTYTKWHGWDPEANNGTITPAWKTSTINKSGDDYEGRPVMRSFTFGINVTF